MKKTVVYISFVVLSLAFGVWSSALAQNTVPFWNLLSLSGELKLEGIYREQSEVLNNSTEKENYSLLSGSLAINTSSYIWNPNFMILNVNAEYSPQKLQEQFIVLPETSESTTLKSLGINTTFFSGKKITFTAFANFSEGYSNRENLSNVRIDAGTYGGVFSYANPLLPVTVNFNKTYGDETELETNSRFSYDQTNLLSHVSKSFFKKDRNELSYSHNEYEYQSLNATPLQNKIDQVYLNDNMFWGENENNKFSSVINDIKQVGADPYSRFASDENISFRLPYNLYLMSDYSYANILQSGENISQNGLNAMLGHRLFESLSSDVTVAYTNTNEGDLDEIYDRAGLDLNYAKKIPLDGMLSLSYSYLFEPYKTTGPSQPVQIKAEPYVLNDALIILLDNPDIEISTVEVEDGTGTIIYQLNFDYYLVQVNKYIEIRRIPGGQIPDNGTVYLYYTYIQPGNYSYNLNSNIFFTQISFFSHFIELYFKVMNQNYNDLENIEFVQLNYISEHLYGAKLNFKIGNVGADYDDFGSNIMPYKLIRYFGQVSFSLKNNLLLSFNGDYRDYLVITNLRNQKYTDVSAMLAYMFGAKSKLNFEVTYRNQNGYQIDLNLLTAKAEYTNLLGKLALTFGIEFYSSYYLSEDIQYKGLYAKISRKF